MLRSRTTAGLGIAVIAAATFGMSGAFVKPMLESGWSPAAAVTARALIGGVVLAPIAIVLLRGRWVALWRARWRVLAMAVVGVAGTQLAYFASIERIPINTAILVEYMSPIVLVLLVWATTRRMPKVVVLVGSVVAIGGLVLVVSPGGEGGLDALGLFYAFLGCLGCVVYYVIAARPSEGLPPVALAAAGLVLGGVLLGLVGLTGLVPFTMSTAPTAMLGGTTPWWVPLLIVGVFSTAIAYASSITGSEILGSRLASFVGLLEVVVAAVYAWILLGEALTIPQLIGGVLILAGIVFIRSEKHAELVTIEPGSSAPAESESNEPVTGIRAVESLR